MPAFHPAANSLQANALGEFAGTSCIARRYHQVEKNEKTRFNHKGEIAHRK